MDVRPCTKRLTTFLLAFGISGCSPSDAAPGPHLALSERLRAIIERHDGVPDPRLSVICDLIDSSPWILRQLARASEDAVEPIPIDDLSMRDLPSEEREIFTLLLGLPEHPSTGYGSLTPRGDYYLPILELARLVKLVLPNDPQAHEALSRACLVLNERGDQRIQMCTGAIRYLHPSLRPASREAPYWILLRQFQLDIVEFGPESEQVRQVYLRLGSEVLGGQIAAGDHRQFLAVLRRIRNEELANPNNEDSIVHSGLFYERSLVRVYDGCGLPHE